MMILLKHIIKKRISHWLILFFVLLCNDSYCQFNLVPNPSFEQYSVCPVNTIYSQTFSSKPNIWYKPDIRGANYFNICTNDQPLDGIPYNRVGGSISYQIPKTGIAYFVMLYGNQNLNNYIQIKLYDSFKLNKYYYSEYFVSLTNTSNMGCNNQSMLFTKKAVYADTSTDCILLANPQITNYGNPIITDTMNWVKVSGIFKAQGGEQYLTLGNFKTWANTQRKTFQNCCYNGAAYYVDDVAVYSLDSFCFKADAGKDITIQQGDSAFIGTYTNGIDSLLWLENGSSKKDSTRPGFYVHPSSNTFYVLQQIVNGCFSSDTVFVNVLLPLNFISYSVSIPLLGGVRGGSIENIWQTANETNVSHFNIQRSFNGRDFKTIGKVSAQNNITNEYSFSDSPPLEGLGVVYYRIESVDKDGRKQYSEIRNMELGIRNSGISIFPNPAKDNLTIQCKGAKELFIIDNLGRKVYRSTVDGLLLTVDAKQFPKGIYAVKVIMANGEIKTEKIFIQ